MINVERKEVYRYLGYHQRFQQADTTDVDRLISECMNDLQAVAHPVYAYKKLPLTISGDTITIGEMLIHSHDLSFNLRDCSDVYLLAATIGLGVDRLIKRANITNVAKAAIYQAIGAAMIESAVDDVNNDIRTLEAQSSHYLRPRYSPGYGDCPLAVQAPFLSLFSQDQLGITLTDTYLMIPSKSVTAFIGVTDKHTTTQSTCDTCSQIDCDMRKESL